MSRVASPLRNLLTLCAVIIEAVGPHPLGKSDWAEFWRASPEFVATKGEIADLKLRVLTASDDAGSEWRCSLYRP